MFIYGAPFTKHLWNLAASGFYTRGLDADDHAFLETVRVRGIANGDLPSTNTVLVEELEFWHLPYAIAPGIARKVGPAPRPTPESPEQRQLRQLRTSAWHARRAVLKHEKEIAAAELERERLEWEKANETRKLREALSDAEWNDAAPRKINEAAAPRKSNLVFGKVVKRHYVPQWKLDERGELNDADARAAARKAKQEQRQRQREQAARQQEARERYIAEQRQRQREEEAREQEARERLAAERALAAARETVARVDDRLRKAHEQRDIMEQALRQQQQQQPPLPDAGRLKRALLAVIRNNAPTPSTHEMLMRATGCSSVELINICLLEMVRDGQIKRKVE